MDTPLKNRIFQAIAEQESGSISFADYMNRCLYDREAGYYARPESRPLGRKGDFFTSVSVGAGFGFLLGMAAEQRWREAGASPGEPFLVVEQGGHDGQLARDFLAGLSERESPLRDSLRYVLYEPRPSLAETLRESLRGTGIEVASELPKTPFSRGLYFANELLDAFPVHRIRREGGIWKEWRVGVSGDDLNGVTSAIDPDSDLGKAVRAIPSREWPEGYTTECCLELEPWIETATAWFQEGHWWVIDYGRESDDYFAPHRTDGTLRGYRDHERLDDPFAAPGETDLTADVNFTEVREVAVARGLEALPLTDQHHFLVRAAEPWLREIESGGPVALAANQRRLRQFQTLTHPTLMGTSFRVAEFRRRGAGSLDVVLSE